MIPFKRWNKILEKGGIRHELRLPSARFRRTVGSWANIPTDPAGNRISPESFAANLPNWIPMPADQSFVASLMKPVYDPGKVANWIAPPERGINNLPVDYEYVRVA